MPKPVTRNEQPIFKGIDENHQPQATDLEAQVLGGLLFLGKSEAATIEGVLSKLDARHFYLTRNAKIYREIVKLWGEGKHVDPMTVAIELGRKAPSQMAEIQRYLVDELCDRVISPGMIDAYADIVIEKAKRRDLISNCVALLDLAIDEGNEWSEVQDHVESKVLSLLNQKPYGGRMLADSMPEAYDRLAEAIATGVIPGIPTQFDDLNEILNGGFRRGQLIVVAARPAMGKSALTVGNFVPWIASTTNEHCLVFSLEMSEEELIHRYWSGRMRNPYAINRLNLQDEDWAELGTIVSEMADLKIYIDDSPKVSIDYIKSESRKFKAQNGSLGCVVIDYLQIMDYGKYGNPVQAIGQITSSLKALAKELDTPVLLLSQLSRGVESREDKRPTLSDLRDSGTIEQDANTVIFLYRDDYYNEDSENPGVTEIIVSKNRGGKKGKCELIFDGPRTLFEPKTHQSYQPQIKGNPEVRVHSNVGNVAGMSKGDRVICAPPEYMDARTREESLKSKEAPYGISGTIVKLFHHQNSFTQETEVWAEFESDDGQRYKAGYEYLQPDF